MNQAIKNLLFISTLLCSTFANSANIEKLFQDKNYWANFNWENVDKSEILLDEVLEVKDADSTNKVVYERFRKIELNGFSFTEAVQRNKLLLKNNKKIFLTLKSDDEANATLEACVKVATMYEKILGKKFEVTEYHSELAGMPTLRNSKKYYEWSNGKTNIQVKCTEIFLGKFYTSVIFSPNVPENTVKKPIKLDCDRTYKLTRNKEVDTAKPLNITILQDEMNVVNADNHLMGKVDELTNTYIKFTTDSEDSIMSYSINRIDGSLTGTYTDKKSNEVMANYNGVCKKRVSEARKF